VNHPLPDVVVGNALPHLLAIAIHCSVRVNLTGHPVLCLQDVEVADVDHSFPGVVLGDASIEEHQ